MGVESSREIIVDLEKVTKKRTIKFYNDENYKNKCFNTVFSNYVGKYTNHFIKTFNVIKEKEKEINVLEIAAGNGMNSKKLNDIIKPNKYIATDLYSHENLKFNVKSNLSSEEGVNKYGSESNVLLIIAPPPNEYVDYYGIKEYELCSSEMNKYLIFVGELGASDGGEGMYNYLLNHNKWNLLHRRILSDDYNNILNDRVIKEIFLFNLKI